MEEKIEPFVQETGISHKKKGNLEKIPGKGPLNSQESGRERGKVRKNRDRQIVQKKILEILKGNLCETRLRRGLLRKRNRSEDDVHRLKGGLMRERSRHEFRGDPEKGGVEVDGKSIWKRKRNHLDQRGGVGVISSTGVNVLLG